MARTIPSRVITALLVAVALASALAATAPAASTSNTVVSAYVPSATTLSTTACAPGVAGRTDFGTILPGSSFVSATDCTVTFGSSNDIGRLRIRQSDGTGAAMWDPLESTCRHASLSIL